MKNRAASIVLLGAMGTVAVSAPIDMAIDPVLSTIDLDMTVDVSVASDTDTESSPLSGSLRVEFDDAGNPTEISLHDLNVVIDETLSFNWAFGFFGSADADLLAGEVTWGSTDAFVGPVPIDEGDFVLLDVPVALQGTLNVFYDIFLVGTGSESINLADQGDFLTQIDGSVSVSGDTITLTSVIPLNATTPLMDSSGATLGTLTVSGSANIVATAPVPGCPADLNSDGVLDFFDVSAFLSAYSSMDPLADFDGNGVFDFFDVSAFLSAFSAGCP